MKHLKTYEKYQLNNIQNIQKISNDKYLKILEYYANVVRDDDSFVELDIPVNFYYFKGDKLEDSTFSYKRNFNWEKYEQLDYEPLKIDKIKKMWIGSSFPDGQDFEEFGDKPDFYVELESKNKKGLHNRFLIEQDDTHVKIIIDEIYNFVMEHQDDVEIKGINKIVDDYDYEKCVGKFFLQKYGYSYEGKEYYLVYSNGVNPEWMVNGEPKIWPKADSFTIFKDGKIGNPGGWGYHYTKDEYDKIDFMTPNELFKKKPTLCIDLYNKISKEMLKGEKGWAEWYWKMLKTYEKALLEIDDLKHHASAKKFNL